MTNICTNPKKVADKNINKSWQRIVDTKLVEKLIARGIISDIDELISFISAERNTIIEIFKQTK